MFESNASFFNVQLNSNIQSLQARQSQVSDTLNEQRRQKYEIDRQLSEANYKVNSLELQHENKKRQVSDKADEMSDLERRLSEHERELSDVSSELEDARFRKDDAESRLERVRQQMVNVTNNQNEVNKQITAWQQVLQVPSPTPHYTIDGEYCINGIHMCKNHPPRQILTNAAAIAQDKRDKDNARQQISSLQNQFDSLNNQYNELLANFRQEESALYLANSSYESLEIRCQNLQSNVQEDKRNCENCSKQYDNLVQEEKQLSIDLNAARNEVDQLSNELMSVEQQTSSLESELRDIEYQLQDLMNSRGSAQDSLQSLARRELELEALAARELMLEEMAHQQLMQEQAGAPQRLLALNDDEADGPTSESAAEAAQPSSLLDRVRSNASEALESVRSVGRQTREVVGDVMTTVGDIYPNALPTLYKNTFNEMNEVMLNEASEHSGNMAVDYATRRRQERDETHQRGMSNR